MPRTSRGGTFQVAIPRFFQERVDVGHDVVTSSSYVLPRYAEHAPAEADELVLAAPVTLPVPACRMERVAVYLYRETALRIREVDARDYSRPVEYPILTFRYRKASV